MGTLRDQMLYPHLDREISTQELSGILETAQLGGLPERVGGFDVELDWADVLSLGEQQRLAFARLLVNRPGFAVLDEATSALDQENEAKLYSTLAAQKIGYISVGHRDSILDFHHWVLELRGEEHWRWLTVAEYRASRASS